MDRFLAVSLLVLAFASEVQAKCACQCINGRMRPICSPGDLLPPNCPMTACPVTGPTVVPIQPAARRPEPPCVCNKDAATVVDRGRDDPQPPLAGRRQKLGWGLRTRITGHRHPARPELGQAATDAHRRGQRRQGDLRTILGEMRSSGPPRSERTAASLSADRLRYPKRDLARPPGVGLDLLLYQNCVCRDSRLDECQERC